MRKPIAISEDFGVLSLTLAFGVKILYTGHMQKMFDVLRIRSFALWIAIVCCAPQISLAQETPRYRALLIACERFVSYVETTPVGKHNLQMVEKILAQDLRGFEISRQYGVTSSKEALAAAIRYAFRDAKKGDISLLYICTHGEFDPNAENQEGYLILSDGALEDRVSASQLQAMLDPIGGTKMLLVDACNSGALIGKGMSPTEEMLSSPRLFQSDDYKLLLSSGANEQSWYWHASLDTTPPGSSYFTTALALGAGYLGGFAADANRDGTITLKEMYNYLWVNQASSTVQMFPQDDDFPFIVYDRALLQQNHSGELIGFVFPSTTLNAEKPILTFQYTATKSTRVVYQINYLKNGVWNWNQDVTLPDESEFDGDADPMGDISPGRKQVTLDLSEILPPGWTYAMIHVITRGDHINNREPFIYAARILSAKNFSDPGLSVRLPRTWSRAEQKELALFVGHIVPCNITLQVINAQGQLVRKLCVSRPTRPQALNPEGSLFYWNGLDEEGKPVAPGVYELVAFTRLGGQRYGAHAKVEIVK